MAWFIFFILSSTRPFFDTNSTTNSALRSLLWLRAQSLASPLVITKGEARDKRSSSKRKAWGLIESGSCPADLFILRFTFGEAKVM